MCKIFLRIFGYPPSEKTKKVEIVTIIGLCVLMENPNKLIYFLVSPLEKPKKEKNVTVIVRNNNLHI